MTTQDPKSLRNIYLHVIGSFTLGMHRFWSAEAAFARLMCALVEFHAVDPPRIDDDPYHGTLDNLLKIPYSSYDSLRYITNVSHLVYATTLLDTFLTDTTHFLFLLFPQSMGKNQQIPLSALLGAPQNQVITEAAAKRAREVSYLSFDERVNFLCETFGLKLVVDETTQMGLEHYPTLRNSAVHDQGVFEAFLDETNSIACRTKTCPRHPSQIVGDDVAKAADAYRALACEIGRAVLLDVIKVPNMTTDDVRKCFAQKPPEEPKHTEH